MRIKDQLSPRSYGQYIHLKVLFLILLLCLTLFIALAAIVCGSSGMPIGAVLRTLAGGGSTQENVIVFNLRGPRVCTAIVAGFGLAIVGCVMQSVLRNPMASASTVGVSQGAAFGAAFAIIALGAGVESVTTSGIVNVTQPYLVSGCAFAGRTRLRALDGQVDTRGVAARHKRNGALRAVIRRFGPGGAGSAAVCFGRRIGSVCGSCAAAGKQAQQRREQQREQPPHVGLSRGRFHFEILLFLLLFGVGKCR